MQQLFLILLTLILLSSCKKENSASAGNELSVNNKCNHSQVPVSAKSPRTINQVVDLINLLPKPLTLPCLVEALERPLSVSLTLSKLSAQPAVGNNSPRIFIFNDDLVLAIVPDGVGSKLLELSEMYSESNSLKAELEFPIISNLSYQAPFSRIDVGGKTTCGTCHKYEQRDNSISNYDAYTSVALRPESTMSIEDFSSENYECQLEVNPSYRCQLILAIFKGSQLIEQDFSAGTPRFIDTLQQ